MIISIVEDDHAAMESLCRMLEKFAAEYHEKVIIRKFYNAITFLTDYKSDYDIVFMDIEMPMMNGMEAAKKLRKLDTKVILYFITNMAQYAIKGYEVGALDFIVKPVTYPQLKMKLERALVEMKRNDSEKIVISHKDGTIRIAVRDIFYIESVGHHICYHTIYGNYEIYGTLKGALNDIHDPLFVHCNRCYVVNIRYVREIRQQEVLVENDRLQISRLRYQPFLQAINEYMGGGKI